MPPAPRSNARRPEVSRQIPSDTLLQSSESALASNDLDGLRASAFRLAPTPTAASQLHRMWIPCPTVIKRRHICEMLDELAKDDQPEIWKDARQNKLLQDFKLIPNAGVRFTCSAYATAVKLSLLKLNAFGQQIQIARFSQFASRYYVDLVRLPDEVTDRMIFDWFATRGSPPTCVCPTYMRNGLPSRERTVYFNQDRPPAVLVPSEDEPLREISFSAPDDGMTELRPCFVNHKVARYNRVTPPSILARQAEEETNNSAQAPPSETAKEGPPTGFSSSLKESIRSTQQPKDGDDSSKKSSESLSDGEKDDIPPSMDDDGSESSETSVKSLETFMAETIPTPSCPPDAALWAKTASNRRALLDVSGPDTVQWSKTTYAFDQDQGLAEATDLIKPNYYAPLWFEDPDAENPKWHFDLEVKQTDQDEANLESTPVHQNGPSYLTTVKPATLTYDVESMTRAELFVFINDFLARFETFSALDQLAAIEANPGLMLGTIETKKSLDRLAANRGFLRVLARSPPGNKISLPERLLKLGKDPSELTTQLVTQAQLNESNEVQTLLTLAAWDIALHIMAPTVYQDPLKLLVLTGENPRFLTNLTIPLLTDRVLWKLSFSSLATELHEYSTTPDFIKALIEAVQAIKPPSDDNSIVNLHF
ncbi:hypothetical protein BBJ28_00025010 [Nothophytophthora sp. Chile5]|nr:hypothetical protein BBJ28_00025010 [Nothophytophthora sp. Chile5]